MVSQDPLKICIVQGDADSGHSILDSNKVKEGEPGRCILGTP